MKTIVRDKFLVALSGVFVVVTLLVLLSIFQHEVTPAAHKGVLDLRGWNFAEDGIVKLNGEWEFYPSQLLQPQDFAENGQNGEKAVKPSHFQAVPSAWAQNICR